MNKKSNYFLLFISFFLPFSLAAQNEEWGKHHIKFTPTRLINALYPGLELGYEYCYGSFSSQFSAAYLINTGIFPNLNSINGYHIKFEEKYLVGRIKKSKPPTNSSRKYLSAEINYNYVKLNENRLFLPVEYEQIDWSEQEQYAYKGNFDLQRKAIVANLKVGVQFKCKKILLEPCAGIGIGFQNVSHYNKPHPDDILFYPGPDMDFTSFTDEEGFNILPNFTISFRIGYIF